MPRPSEPDAGRRLTALVFGTDHHPPDPLQRYEVMAALKDSRRIHILIDQAMENIVQDIVGRQAVHVGLARLQFSTGRPGR